MKWVNSISSFRDYIGINSIIYLLGGFLILFITHRLVIDRNKRKQISEAYNTFRETFSYALGELEKDDLIHVEVVLSEFPKHEEAMQRFILNLEGYSLIRFKQTWSKYKESYDHYKKYRSLLNSFKTMEESEEVLYKQKLLAVIHEILENAKKY